MHTHTHSSEHSTHAYTPSTHTRSSRQPYCCGTREAGGGLVPLLKGLTSVMVLMVERVLVIYFPTHNPCLTWDSNPRPSGYKSDSLTISDRLEWANALIQWHLALFRGVLCTDESRFSLYRADSVYGVMCVSGLLMSMLWIEWPMVAVGLCMGRRMLWTMNTAAFYWWHFECTEIPWRDSEVLRFTVFWTDKVCSQTKVCNRVSQ